MIELKRHVERIVRPICASESRKYRMREELFAHLVASAEEAGEEAAIARLGTVEDVRRELQASVPKWEAFGNAYDPLKIGAAFRQLIDPVNRRYARPAARLAVSAMLFLAPISAVAVVVVCGVLVLRTDGVESSRVALGLFAGIATSAVVASWLGTCMFMVSYLGARLRVVQCLHSSSAAPGVVKAFVVYGLMAGYVVPFAVGFLFGVESVLGRTRVAFEMRDLAGFVVEHALVYALIGFGGLVAVTARQFAESRRHYLEWDSLRIDG